jgi:hypothetical protein
MRSVYMEKEVTGVHVTVFLQERIINDLSLEMETTSNRLDFVQVISPSSESEPIYIALMPQFVPLTVRRHTRA